MRKPKSDGPYPDRALDCEEAISEAVSDLIEQAQFAGWDRIEAAEAIARFAKGIKMSETGTDPEE